MQLDKHTYSIRLCNMNISGSIIVIIAEVVGESVIQGHETSHKQVGQTDITEGGIFIRQLGEKVKVIFLKNCFIVFTGP